MEKKSLDMATAKKDLTTSGARFKVTELNKNIPVFILRRPEDTRFCTKPVKKHWFNDPRGQEDAIVPCKKSVLDQPDFLDMVCDELVNNQSYYTLTKDQREFLEGSIAHDCQLIDMRDHTGLINAYQAAMKTGDQQAAAKALGEIHAVILTLPIKTWSFSRTVFGLIMGLLTTFEETYGEFRDPTDFETAHLLYVKKAKAGKGPARYEVQFGWHTPFTLPEALFTADDRVKTYDAIMHGYQKQLAYWPEKRLMDLCHLAGIPTGLTPEGPALVIGQTQQALPPAAPPAPPVAAPPVPGMATAPSPPSAPPVVPKVIEGEAIVVEAPVIPGASKSAKELKCFGQAPNFEKQQCIECAQASACMAAMQERLQKPTAVATAPAVTPPVAEPETTDQVNDRVESMITECLDSATKGE